MTPDPPGVGGTLLGLYIEPVDTFRAVASRPGWALPFLGFLALNVVFTLVWLRHVDPVEFTRVQMEERGVFDRIPADQHGAVVEQQAKMFPVLVWLGPAVFIPLTFVAMAAVLLFVFRFFYASETTFAQAMAVVSWTMFAVGLVSVPLLLLVLALKGDWNIDPRTALQAGPAVFFEKGDVPKAVHSLLDSIDLFSFWILFLLSAGFAAASGRSVGSAAKALVVLWAVYVLLKVGLSAVF